MMKRVLVLLTSGMALTSLCGCGNEPIEKGIVSGEVERGIVEEYVEENYDNADFSVLNYDNETITFKVYHEDGPSDIIEIGRN